MGVLHRGGRNPCWPCSALYEAYLRASSRWPLVVLVAWGCFFFLVLTTCALLGEWPELETDLEASDYLRSDGVIADRHDNLRAAVSREGQRRRRSLARGRRLPAFLVAGRPALQRNAERPWPQEHVWEDPEDQDRRHDHEYMGPIGAASSRVRSAARRLNPSARQPLGRRGRWRVHVYFEANDVFDPAVLDEVRELEQNFEALPSYTKFCYVRASNQPCSRPFSATRFLHGTLLPIRGALQERIAYSIAPDGNSEERRSLGPVLTAMSEKRRWSGLSGLHDRLWNFDLAFPHPKLLRARFYFGTPVAGFSSGSDRKKMQESMYEDFVKHEIYPFLADLSTERVKVYYEGEILNQHAWLMVVIRDSKHAIVSCVLVWTFMSVYSKAPLMAFWGMATVLFSIPLCVFFFCAAGQPRFPIMNVWVLFILAGIGADHLFILMDTWRQTKGELADAQERIRVTLGRAGKAIIACSVTTAASFLANLWSSVRPLRNFGAFVGLCILTNLIVCLALFPPALVLRERWKPTYRKLCCHRLMATAEETTKVTSNITLASASLGRPSGVPVDAVPEASSCANLKPASLDSSLSFAEHFFGCVFLPVVHRCRWCLLVLGLLATIVSLAVVGQVLKVSEDPPRFFSPGTHNLGDVRYKRRAFGNRRFTAAMHREPLYICNGCQWPDDNVSFALPTGCEMFGPICLDLPCFKTSVPCARRGMCRSHGRCTCDAGFVGPGCLEREDEFSADCGLIRCAGRRMSADTTSSTTTLVSDAPLMTPYTRSVILTTTAKSTAAASTTTTTSASTSTFMHRMSTLASPLRRPPTGGERLPDSDIAKVRVVFGLKGEAPSGGGDPVLDEGFDLSSQMTQQLVERTCLLIAEQAERLAVRSLRCFVEDFKANLLQRQRPEFPVVPGYAVHGLLTDFLRGQGGKRWRGHVGLSEDGAYVRWLFAEALTNLPRTMAAADAWDWAERWDRFVDERNSEWHGHMFHTSDLWVRAETELRLIDSTGKSALTSVALALVCVFLFLCNPVLAVYIVLTIVCIILCLSALMFGAFRWTFGAVEAVGLIVFVGFSVDYVLHVAEAFQGSAADQSYARVQDALRRTGGALMAAATTTVLAAAPILLCLNQVLVKFGLSLIMNTVVSLLFSLGFFAAVLLVAGPPKECGMCFRHNEKVTDEATVVGTVVYETPHSGSGPGGYRWTTGGDEEGKDVSTNKGKEGQP